jgi:hypothetical protein
MKLYMSYCDYSVLLVMYTEYRVIGSTIYYYVYPVYLKVD